MGKLENLVNIAWHKGLPLIMTAADAYTLSSHDHHFYVVTWLGNEPQSFAPFTFTGLVSGGYEIKLLEEADPIMMALEADEWVLIFK